MEIKRENLSGKIAAFVSGGVDSMVMLDLLYKSGADLLAVHVNHKIRDEADSDCAFVQEFCLKKGIPFVKYSFDIPDMARQSGRSIETEARLARRSVAKELIEGGKAYKVAFAHHADDNAETVLMHILRGCGIDGLKGIEQTNSVLRPLLDYTREEIESYAKQNDIPYVEDKTNADTVYTRNFIRHEVLPLIKTRYPAAVKALNRLSVNALETVDSLDSQIDFSLITECGGVVYLSLLALDLPLASRYVFLSAKKLMPVDVTRAQIQGVLALKNSKVGSKAELGGSLKAYKEYNRIAFCFEKQKQDFCVPFFVGKTCIDSKILNVSEVEPIPVKGKTIISACLPEGCVFRNRHEGDKFTPYGGHKKSLKKYLIDKKIPLKDRDGLVCLAVDDEVLAIVGVEISDKLKLDGQSKAAYLLEVTNEAR